MTADSSAPSAEPLALRVEAWAGIPRLAHGFFGRHGGVSGSHWTSLNVSDAVGDDAQHVATNWERITQTVPSLSLRRMRQVHGVRVVKAEADQIPGEADGMVTGAGGVGLAVLTADCVPMLCVAADAGVVMALHAGWRGTLDGIAVAGLNAAQHWFDVAPDQWWIALGPSIDGCCYEVEAHIGTRFIDRWGAMPDAWQQAGPRGQLDLRRANRAILVASGVPDGQIACVGPCTACRSSDYFSHRRSGGRTGRQLSLIGWAAPPEG